MRRFAATLLVILASSVHADDLVLISGKKLPWKSITDNGDTYTIENGPGHRLIVQKSDVERFEKSAKVEAPITGAAFVLDPKRKRGLIDLMGRVAGIKGALPAAWKYSSGSLVARVEERAHSRICFGIAPPEEYDLSMLVERLDGFEDLYVGLVAKGKQFTFHIDCAGGTWSGPHVVNGVQAGPDNGCGLPGGPILKKGKPRKIQFMVRKDALLVMLDDKDFFGWNTDWSQVALHRELQVADRSSIFIGVCSSSFKVSNAILSFLE